MGTPISYGLINPDGTPCTTASPTFVAFCTKAGTVRGQPAINRFSGGQYEAQISDADETAGTVWLIDNGIGPLPRYVYGESFTPNNPFLTLCVFGLDGSLGGAAPTVGSYIDGQDNVRPAPTVTAVSSFAYLFTITPTLQDTVLGTSYRVDGAANTLPTFLNGLFYNPDAVDPPASSTTSAIAPAGSALEDALRAWVMAGSGLAAGQVIFQQQTGRRPDGAFATVRVGGSRQVGAFDEVQNLTDIGRDPGSEIELRVTGIRELPVTVQFFSAASVGDVTPTETAARTQLALSLPSVRTALAAAGLTPFDAGSINNIAALLGTKFEARAVLETRFYSIRTLSEFAGYIDTVNTRDFMGPPQEGTAETIDI